MAKREGSDKWWLTILVAVLPGLIAGWFSLKAIDKANESSAKAEKTSGELTVAYELMKQALEVVQHEADADRAALQKTNELLIQLLQAKSQRNQAEVAMLREARELNDKLLLPPRGLTHFPPNVHQLWLEKQVAPSPSP
jgi:hypothetical protein